MAMWVNQQRPSGQPVPEPREVIISRHAGKCKPDLVGEADQCSAGIFALNCYFSSELTCNIQKLLTWYPPVWGLKKP